MKKSVLFCFSMLLSGYLSAQFSEEFNYGPKAGFLASTMVTNEADFKETVNNSFLGGAFIRLNFNRFYLQPEVCYQTKGGVFERTSPGLSLKKTVLLSSLDVPLLFGYLLAGKDSPNIRIMAGPVASFPVKKEIRIEQDGVSQKGDKENLKDFNAGLQAGIGADFLFLSLDARYEYGLTELYRSPAPANEVVYRNNLWNISLAIKF